LILLDENGKNHSSVGFSEELQKNELWRKTFIVIEGLWFLDTVYAKAQGKISLSLMTFLTKWYAFFY
jgi:23S rRNA (pseudouridine1915-N3)-methyltransferase